MIRTPLITIGIVAGAVAAALVILVVIVERARTSELVSMNEARLLHKVATTDIDGMSGRKYSLIYRSMDGRKYCFLKLPSNGAGSVWLLINPTYGSDAFQYPLGSEFNIDAATIAEIEKEPELAQCAKNRLNLSPTRR